ncbi:MAG: isoprenylcysteine carboxylmethyltransferase family protein [Proteobacteria bacterium]|jgi:protein-S-isoprenylcysteine O-methyltransferase Ste14|nr:isoprenylcysteine carboxylmethyltransferase family protein [Pseudomonadota bacterium]MCG2822392.1 isoprenylcysteine carboxylmethyltransferase family protein [Desulfobulbaceae bacterium]MDP2003151.1 isoprenylcysteine carboxylmethyltransferase family protein [Desulfurivibrionaceae bacterium]PKN22600.1 MAG: isoprenylcysteine carboxylmethyltransferase family protein [Deltaproteobacteria bacterium HGW-Deltaproteobacteria-3]MBU4230309.1 isoprenylcysteine carboxylmethyltransferase family protein [P
MHTAAERYRLGFSWFVGLFFVFSTIFSKSAQWGSLLYEFLELVGYGLIVLATLGRIWATVYIGGRKDEELCQDGPYSISRNPLYVFSLLGAIGIIFAAREPAFLVIILPFFVYYYFVIRGEEARLLDFFGQEYADYSKRVGRILPTFKTYTSQESFIVYPKVLFRSMIHASMFMWIFMLLEILEYLKDRTTLLPTLLTLPF